MMEYYSETRLELGSEIVEEAAQTQKTIAGIDMEAAEVNNSRAWVAWCGEALWDIHLVRMVRVETTENIGGVLAKVDWQGYVDRGYGQMRAKLRTTL
jgi:hypothetical protein